MDLHFFLYFYTLLILEGFNYMMCPLLHGALYWRDNDESMSLFFYRSLRSHQSCLGKRRKIGEVWVISKRTRVFPTPFGVSHGFTKLICATLIFIATWCVLWISLVSLQWALYTIVTWIVDVIVFICTWSFISYHVQYTLSTIIVKFKHVWENHQDLTPQKKLKVNTSTMPSEQFKLVNYYRLWWLIWWLTGGLDSWDLLMKGIVTLGVPLEFQSTNPNHQLSNEKNLVELFRVYRGLYGPVIYSYMGIIVNH